MKRTIHLLTFLLFTGCIDNYDEVRFVTPQPTSVKPAQKFDKKFQGEYANYTNPNDMLSIQEKTILNHRTLNFKIHRNELVLDSTHIIDRNDNESITQLLEKEGLNVHIEADTIHANKTTTDTIFAISEESLLKKYKRSHFLNYKSDESHWSVKRLMIHKDTLLIGEIFPSDTLLQFSFVDKKTTTIADDSTQASEYIVKPSRREFRKLMKPNSFSVTECYLKKR